MGNGRREKEGGGLRIIRHNGKELCLADLSILIKVELVNHSLSRITNAVSNQPAALLVEP